MEMARWPIPANWAPDATVPPWVKGRCSRSWWLKPSEWRRRRGDDMVSKTASNWLRDRLTERQADWKTDRLRQKDSLTDGLIKRLTDKQANWETGWLRDSLTQRQSEKQANWETDWLRDWLRVWLTDRLTERQCDWQTDWETVWLRDSLIKRLTERQSWLSMFCDSVSVLRQQQREPSLREQLFRLHVCSPGRQL